VQERTGSSHAPLARPHLLPLIDDELPDREWDELGTDKVDKRGSCGGIDVGGCRSAPASRVCVVGAEGEKRRASIAGGRGPELHAREADERVLAGACLL
jgi:hypothetical protein